MAGRFFDVKEDGRKVGAPLTIDREQWSVMADSGTREN